MFISYIAYISLYKPFCLYLRKKRESNSRIPKDSLRFPIWHITTLSLFQLLVSQLPFTPSSLFSGGSETRTHTPLGPTVFKTAKLRPTALIPPSNKNINSTSGEVRTPYGKVLEARPPLGCHSCIDQDVKELNEPTFVVFLWGDRRGLNPHVRYGPLFHRQVRLTNIRL
jgi:hypothetical protein